MLFPYSTDRDLQRMPWATISLIAVNLLCVLAWFDPEVMKALIFNPQALEWWQPLTALFMHAGIMHLLGNMLVLWVFGTHVEDTVGIPKYLLLYFSSGLGALALQVLSDQVFYGKLHGGLGASGAIMGLVALFATRYRRVGVNFFYLWWFYPGTFTVAAMWVALVYAGLNLAEGLAYGLSGTSGGVGFWAHLGGFAIGLAWSYGLKLPEICMAEEAGTAARSWAAAGAYKKAGATLEAALRKAPWDPDLHAQAAECYARDPSAQALAARHWTQALQIWLKQGAADQVAAEWPHLSGKLSVADLDPRLACELGLCLEKAGLTPSAERVYAGLVEAHPEAPEAPGAAKRVADLAARRGNAEGARQWYEHLVKRWPDSLEALEAEAKLRG